MSHLHDSKSLKINNQFRCTLTLTADQIVNWEKKKVVKPQYSNAASDTKVKSSQSWEYSQACDESSEFNSSNTTKYL